MNIVVTSVLVASTWLAVIQGTPTPAQELWLQRFEGDWVVDGAVGADADLVLSVARDGNRLVLKVVIRGRENVTRYDLSGADVVNENLAGRATFRTRIDGSKLVTEIWQGPVAGPPARVETRYLESADIMATELANPSGGQAFNRTVLRRKGK